MAWFNLRGLSPRQSERLDAATAGHLAAQAGVHAEADAVALSAATARRRSERDREVLRENSQQVRNQPLHTSDMLRNVEDALEEMRLNARRRATQKH